MDFQQMLRDQYDLMANPSLEKLHAFHAKYNELEAPSFLKMDDLTLWNGIHKARVMYKKLTEPERQKSVAWLEERGFEVPSFLA